MACTRSSTCLCSSACISSMHHRSLHHGNARVHMLQRNRYKLDRKMQVHKHGADPHMLLSALCGEDALVSKGGGFTASRASLPSGFLLPPRTFAPVGTMRGSDSWMPSISKVAARPAATPAPTPATPWCACLVRSSKL